MTYTIQYLNLSNELCVAGFANIEQLEDFIEDMGKYLDDCQERKEYLKDLQAELELQHKFFPVNKVN
jgi:ABC-type Fe3+-hydroxamate transport system substrate-binding protein